MTPTVDPMVLPVAFPLAAGVICLLLPLRAQRACGMLALASAAVTVALVWPLVSNPGAAREVGGWLLLRVDALSALVVFAVAVLGFLIALYSVGYMRGREHQRMFFACLLWTVGAGCGVALANDLLVLLVFWGFLALTLYLMIGLSGPGAAEAARKALMIVGGADALLVLGVALVWSLVGSTRMDSGALPMDRVGAHAAFIAFVVAAFAKAGAMPLHTWVPSCCEKALVPVTALLPASLDKLLGMYLFVRCVSDLFEPSAVMLTILMLFGAVAVLSAGLLALVQRDLKRVFAYSSIGQVGYMVLTIAMGTPLGIAAGLFHMLNNAIYKCCLFLCAGAVEKAAGTTDLDRLGGLAKTMPVTFAAFTVAALSISGIPPLSGFASKWMIYQGIIDAGQTGGWWIIWLVTAMFGSAFTLAAMVKVLHATFLCKPAPAIAQQSVREAPISMLLPMVALAALCVLFGVFAYAIPLDLLIFPAVRADIPGVWWSGPATLLVLAAIGAGVLLYAVTMAGGRLRRTETYIGGERLDEVHISGAESGPNRHVEVTGTDFYDAVEHLPGVRQFFALSRKKLFDVYEVGAASASHLAAVLRGIHTGALPLYLIWILAGLLTVIYAVTASGVPHD